jgi:phosphate uptake regulator
MAEDLLDISRKMVEDVDGVIRNLEDMTELSGVNQVLLNNALQAAQDASGGAKKLNESNEIRDAAELAGLLTDIDLSGDLTNLEQRVTQELERIGALVDEIRSPDIDKDQITQILEDLEAEIHQMQNAAIKKGIGLLATVARVAIPLI